MGCGASLAKHKEIRDEAPRPPSPPPPEDSVGVAPARTKSHEDGAPRILSTSQTIHQSSKSMLLPAVRMKESKKALIPPVSTRSSNESLLHVVLDESTPQMARPPTDSAKKYSTGSRRIHRIMSIRSAGDDRLLSDFLGGSIDEVHFLAQWATYPFHHKSRLVLDMALLLERMETLLALNHTVSETLQGFALKQQAVINLVCDTLDAERAALFIVDHEKGDMWVRDPTLGCDFRFLRFEGVEGYVLKTGRTLVLNDAYADRRFSKEYDEKTGFRTKNIICMAIPDPTGKTMAVISVMNKNDGEFDESDEAALLALSIQAGANLFHARVYEEFVVAGETCAPLSEVTKAIAEEMCVEKVRRRVVTDTMRHLGCTRVHVYTHDAEKRVLYTQVEEKTCEIGEKEGAVGMCFCLGHSVNSATCPEKQALSDPLFERDLVDDAPVGCCCAPYYNEKGSVVGVLQAMNKRDGTVFTQGDEDSLNSLALRAGNSLHHAGLFNAAFLSLNSDALHRSDHVDLGLNYKLLTGEISEQEFIMRFMELLCDEQHYWVVEMMKQLKRVTVLLALNQAISHALLRMDEAIQTILSLACRALNADRATLFVSDEERGELWSKSGKGSPEIRIPNNKGIAGHVFTTGKPVRLEDAYDDPRFNRHVDKLSGYRTKAMLCSPVPDPKGHRVAVIQVINKKGDTDTFSNADVAKLEELTIRMGLSLYQATKYEDLMGDISTSALMKQVTQAIAREVSLAGAMERVVCEACEKLDADRATVFLSDVEKGELFSKVAKDATVIRIPATEGIVGYTYMNEEIVNVSDVRRDTRWNRSVDKETGYVTKSMLSMPILDKEMTCIGVLQIINKYGGSFDNVDEATGKPLTLKAGISLTYARMFEDTFAAPEA